MTTSTAPLAAHVTWRWREDVLAVQRITEGGSAVAAALPGLDDGFVLARVRDRRALAAVPAGAKAWIVRAAGEHEIVEGPAEFMLARGDAAWLAFGAIAAEMVMDEAETLPRGKRRSSGAWLGLGLAALAHAVVLGLAAQDAMASNEELRADERTQDLKGLLAAAEQRAHASEVRLEDGAGAGEGRVENERHGDGRAGGGAKSAGEEGSLGDRLARHGGARRYAVRAKSGRMTTARLHAWKRSPTRARSE